MTEKEADSIKHKIGKNLFYSDSNININRLNEGKTATVMITVNLLFNSSGVFENLSDDDIIKSVDNKIAVLKSYIQVKPPSF